MGASLRHGAGDGDALALAARELDAALAQVGVVAVRPLKSSSVRMKSWRGAPGGGDDLLVGGVGAAVADVVAGRAVEHGRLLRDHADGAAERLLGDLAHVLPPTSTRPFSTS
jgi:hypothetical protein